MSDSPAPAPPPSDVQSDVITDLFDNGTAAQAVQQENAVDLIQQEEGENLFRTKRERSCFK